MFSRFMRCVLNALAGISPLSFWFSRAPKGSATLALPFGARLNQKERGEIPANALRTHLMKRENIDWLAALNPKVAAQKKDSARAQKKLAVISKIAGDIENLRA